jgi:putative ABC transport system substrate-binding protein
VFVTGEPVKAGLVASYSRPGGNATGINLLTTTMEPKRVGILHDLMPQAATIAVLVDPRFPTAGMQSRDIEEAAHAIGIQTEVFYASTDNEINAAFPIDRTALTAGAARCGFSILRHAPWQPNRSGGAT